MAAWTAHYKEEKGKSREIVASRPAIPISLLGLALVMGSGACGVIIAVSTQAVLFLSVFLFQLLACFNYSQLFGTHIVAILGVLFIFFSFCKCAMQHTREVPRCA